MSATERVQRPRDDAPARILVVEDEVIVALDIKQSLQRLGYTVVDTVTNGPAALGAVESQPVDLVLMDIHLEGDMDGIEAAARLRAEHDVPVVYLTAYADDETLARARITEPFGYAVKPYEERELKGAIEIGLYKHRMDRRLRESEHRLDSILRSIDDAVIVIDHERRLSFVNRTARQLMNTDQHQPAFEIVGVVHVARGARTVESDGWPELEPSQFDATLRVSESHTVPVEGTFSAVRDDKGTRLGWVLVFRDTTQRRRAIATSRRLASIVTTSQDAILSVDHDGRIQTWNQAAERLFGYAPREAHDQAIDELLFAGNERIAAELVAHIHEGRPYAIKETSATARDGGRRDISLDVSPMHDEAGRVSGASIILHDIARRKSLEKEVDHLRRQLEDRARSLV